jgi:DNA-binding NtrC family response regulator
MSTTLSVLERTRVPGKRRARLYLVLEGCRPLAGSVRWSLSDIEEAHIGRGDARKSRRKSHAGVSMLEIEVPDRRMSGDHARLASVGGRWVLQDRDSKNGTRVNGTRVTRAVLESGDLLELGTTHWLYAEAVEHDDDASDLDGGDLANAMGLTTVIPSVASAFSRLGAVAKTDVPVLVTGESGTGKELVARALHERSERKGRFVAVNCGALPEHLVESELFGSKRGAYTGSTEDRSGFIRSAHRGTLLLDEVGDLPRTAQAALLRALQQHEVTPVGDATPVAVDFRVVAATHRDLDDLVVSGDFRSDLLARLRGFEIELPPLRERIADLGLVTAALLRKLGSSEAGQLAIDSEASRALVRYDWPLNVRELEQALSVAVALSGGDTITLEHLPEALRRPSKPSPAEPELGEEDIAQRTRLTDLLREHAGNVSAVARAMGKDRKQIRRWIERYHLRVERDDG